MKDGEDLNAQPDQLERVIRNVPDNYLKSTIADLRTELGESRLSEPDRQGLNRLLMIAEREQARRRLAKASKESRAQLRADSASRPKLVQPPRLLFASMLKRLLSPAAYKRFVEPHIADMHEQYFAALVQKDESGARWAVVRAHLYVIPSWLWALAGGLIARVIDWIRT